MKIQIQKAANCPAATAVVAMFDAGNFAGNIRLATQGARIYAFLDDPSKNEAAIGRVSGIDAVPANYRIQLESIDRSGKNPKFQCELEILGATPTISYGSSAEVDAEVERIVSSGIASRESAEWARDVMLASNVPVDVQLANFAGWRRYDCVPAVHTAYRNLLPEGKESFMTTALISYEVQGALILRGGKSLGKNVFATTFAAVKNLPCYTINFNDRMTPAQIFGESTVDNSALDSITPEMADAYLRVQEGHPMPNDRKLAAQYEWLKTRASAVQIRHVESTVIKWARYGGVLLLDEMNMAEPNLLQQLVNPLTDGSRLLMVPGEDPIRLHECCFLMAGMNPPTYDGTYALNDATASRMGVLDFEHSGTIIPALRANFRDDDLPKSWGTKEEAQQKWNELLEKCDRFFNRCKADVDANATSDQILNIRGFVTALRGYLRFPGSTSIKQQLQTYVVNCCQDEDEKGIFLQKLDDTFG